MAETFLAWLKGEIPRWGEIAQGVLREKGLANLAFSGMDGGEGALAGHDLFARLDQPAGRGWREEFDGMWGHGRLREEVAGIYGARSAENVLIVSGATQAAFLTLTALAHHWRAKPGRKALVESPGYGPLFEVPRYLGFELVGLERLLEKGYGIAGKGAIAADIAVISNPHNPSGILVGREEIAGLLGRLPDQAIVVVDETFLAPKDGHFSAAGLGDPRIIVLGSLSKTVGLGLLRAGWVIGCGETLSFLRELWIQGFNIGSKLTEALAGEVLRERRGHEERVGALGRANLELVAQTLDELQRRGLVEWQNPGQGSIAFPRLVVKQGVDAKGAIWRFYRMALERQGVAIIPGSWFDPMDRDRANAEAASASACQSHIRVGFGMPTAALRAGLGRLREAVENFAN